MKPIWTSDRLVTALGGSVSGAIPDISGVSIDTRTLQPGDLFVALTGDSRDGHAFVRAAFDKGAAAALINVAHHAELQNTGPVIAVEDTLDSLRHLGIAARERSSARICAVTGSVGKPEQRTRCGLCWRFRARRTLRLPPIIIISGCR